MPLTASRLGPDPIVLVVGDSGLRSSLTARLGLAGETVVTAADARDDKIAPRLRERAILVIDDVSLDGARAEAVWDGPVILIADAPDAWPRHPRLSVVARLGAARKLSGAIESLRAIAA